jgi:hypothetical protein
LTDGDGWSLESDSVRSRRLAEPAFLRIGSPIDKVDGPEGVG